MWGTRRTALCALASLALTGLGAPAFAGAQTPADTAAPVMTALHAIHPVFRADGAKVPKRKKGDRRKAAWLGTTFYFVLDEPAFLEVVITHGSKRMGPALRASYPSGIGELPFNGDVVPGRPLRPGTYSATFSVWDEAGNHAAPQVVKFRIVRR